MRQLSLYEAFAVDRPPPTPPPPSRRAVSPVTVARPPPAGLKPPPPSRRSASPTTTTTTTTASQSESDGTPCYICHEPTTETSQCRCKPVVHADCLLRSIRVSKRPHCTICHSPIANLRVCHQRRYYVPLTVLLYLSGIFVGIASVSAALSVAEAAEEQELEAFYRLLIRSVACTMEAIGASKLFTWLLERRESEAVHAQFEYVAGDGGTTTAALASVGRRLGASVLRRNG